jgi:5-methylcytosine-specific restriction endonuclease McrBC regulatory subunit McrC
MSIRGGRSRKTIERNIEGALDARITVEEKGKRTVEEYPDDISTQLKRAAFSEAEAANTYVKHVRPTNSDDDSKVVTVEVLDEGLVIEAEDIVGIVNLTPNATLQIDPKIGWSEILDMFLYVGEQSRTLEYRGIPIREFLADDIGLKDIFIVVALNYLNSLDVIFRHGFIRSFKRERSRGLQGRGRIDIQQSLKNFDLANGVPKHEFVEKKIEYGIPVNNIIYEAGVELERLFHFYSKSNAGENYTRIFSRLERAVNSLEHRGITGESISLGDVSKVGIDDIPRQRHYYADALQISKTILSSTIGQPLDEGRKELLMEYIIGMESLFEEYVALSLGEELQRLQNSFTTTNLDGISIEKKSYQLFENENLTFSSQPDHVVLNGDGDPEAVLDSKYYAKDKDPLKGSWARSRLLSYGFQLETDCLGVIAPLAEPANYAFNNRSGALHVVAPAESQFTTEGLRNAIHSFLRDIVAEEEEIQATKDIQRLGVSHPDVNVSSLDEALSSPVLKGNRIVNDSREILKYITSGARLSEEVNPRGIPWYDPLEEFQRYLSEHIEDYEVAIPVFICSSDQEADRIREEAGSEEDGDQDTRYGDSTEFIRFHCFHLDEFDTPEEYVQPPPFSIKW